MRMALTPLAGCVLTKYAPAIAEDFGTLVHQIRKCKLSAKNQQPLSVKARTWQLWKNLMPYKETTWCINPYRVRKLLPHDTPLVRQTNTLSSQGSILLDLFNGLLKSGRQTPSR